MKILLLGKGKSIKYIKKYLKYKKVEIIHAVFKEEYNKKYVLADNKLLELDDIDYVIKSPGIPETNSLYIKLSLKFKFINELDLLTIFNEKVKSIVITGSNGKTTFVSMLNYLLKLAGLKTILCGNSFEPISKYYKKYNEIDYLVVEQSSFQLHNLSFHKPFISLILNLQENHLDNSYSLNSYFKNKMNIFKYIDKQCYFISDNNPLVNLSRCNGNIIEIFKYPYSDRLNDNLKHYKQNINYLYTIIKLLSLDEKLIEKLNCFNFLKYRNEIKITNDITFINDSKSTSLDATLFALSKIDKNKNIILILGGMDKKLDYKRIALIKVSNLIVYGRISKQVKKYYKNAIITNNLYESFKIATLIKLDNKVVLFSPSTSSYDEFKNFEERGAYFNKLVKRYEKNKL